MMFEEPTFLVQIGFQGRQRAIEALEEGYADGGVLSPADYKYKTNSNLADELNELGGLVFFDPQFYIPRTDRQDLNTYPYFETRGGENFSTGIFASRDEREELCRDILAVQDDFEVDAYITPARFLDGFTEANLDRWLDITDSFLEVAKEDGRDIPIFASLPIDGFELNDEERHSRLLNSITKIDADGFYVSIQYDDFDTRLPLKGEDNVYSHLKLMSTLRMNRYEILPAHTHQIAHLLYGLGINAFASGHNQNLRSFDIDRWEPSDEEQYATRVVRYYSDSLLDSLRIDSDLEELVAENFDLSKIRTGSPYEDDLFDTTTTPKESGWKFSGASWEHYLWSCDKIRAQYQGQDPSERLDTAKNVVEGAKELYEEIVQEIGELDSVEDDIYDDWLNAYEDARNEIDERRLKIILR